MPFYDALTTDKKKGLNGWTTSLVSVPFFRDSSTNLEVKCKLDDGLSFLNNTMCFYLSIQGSFSGSSQLTNWCTLHQIVKLRGKCRSANDVRVSPSLVGARLLSRTFFSVRFLYDFLLFCLLSFSFFSLCRTRT